jgi:hypothetical protein
MPKFLIDLHAIRAVALVGRLSDGLIRFDPSAWASRGPELDTRRGRALWFRRRGLPVDPGRWARVPASTLLLAAGLMTGDADLRHPPPAPPPRDLLRHRWSARLIVAAIDRHSGTPIRRARAWSPSASQIYA